MIEQYTALCRRIEELCDLIAETASEHFGVAPEDVTESDIARATSVEHSLESARKYAFNIAVPMPPSVTEYAKTPAPRTLEQWDEIQGRNGHGVVSDEDNLEARR